MIYLLTAIGLSPGGRSTVHIYTQTIHRTIQNKQYIEQHNRLKIRSVVCPEKSVTIYQHSQHKIPEKKRPQKRGRRKTEFSRRRSKLNRPVDVSIGENLARTDGV